MSLSNYTHILDTISDAAFYEQLAEECVELAHACLKKARKIREENPTPLSSEDIDDMIEEEYTDVILVSEMIGLSINRDTYYKKIDRWAERLS